jgi:hypothetical protein
MRKQDGEENTANHDNRSLTPQKEQSTSDEMGTTRKGRSHLCFYTLPKI